MSDRWQNLKGFIAEWYRPLTAVDGLPLEQIEVAEKQVGFRLPEALRELYQLIGANADLTGQQNYLLAPEDLEIEDEYVWIWNENQNVWGFGIEEEDLNVPDPPMQFYMDGEWDESESGKPLSEIALLMIAMDLITAGELSAYGSAGTHEMFGGQRDVYEKVVNDIVNRGVPSPYPILADNRFFVVEGVLTQPYLDGLRILAPDKPILLEAMNKLDQLDWSYNSIEDN